MLMRAGIDPGALRAREFARLDRQGHVYLDYAGAALYPASLVRRHATHLLEEILGNPHSESTPSRASTRAIEIARTETLRFVNADPAEFDVIFTANASAAVRILAEAFRFTVGSRLVLTADNHNSVNGLRSAARRRGATVEYVPLEVDLRSPDPDAWLAPADRPSLFAYPAQSNFSGVRHPLGWVRLAQERGYRVLLDAAALVPTAPLSLSEVGADFVALSFYKIFGYPTGIGALIARRCSLGALRRRYFGGGTVQFVSVQNSRMRLKSGADAFEDGTPNFLALPAVIDGLRWTRGIGMARVEEHVGRLVRYLLDGFSTFGSRVEVYGPREASARGGIVAFNLRQRGRVIPYEEVEAAARQRGIAIRGGCFCNPGAAERAFGFDAGRARACLRGPFSVATFRACMADSPVGAVRASIGLPTTAGDIDALIGLVDTMTR